MNTDWEGRVLLLVLVLLSLPVALGRSLGFDVPAKHAEVAAGVCTVAVLLLLLSGRTRSDTARHAPDPLLRLPPRVVRSRR